jgi:hypothetical protein
MDIMEAKIMIMIRMIMEYINIVIQKNVIQMIQIKNDGKIIERHVMLHVN